MVQWVQLSFRCLGLQGTHMHAVLCRILARRRVRRDICGRMERGQYPQVAARVGNRWGHRFQMERPRSPEYIELSQRLDQIEATVAELARLMGTAGRDQDAER